jgi:beta-phosphoglucomutase-like phosphatase (HAD superfamily)
MHGRIPFALVSGSTRDSVTTSLRTLQLLEKFETLVCAGDYKRGKPDPEAFLIAAGRLGVKPECCLVFEDTDMGIEAATAGGMASVGCRRRGVGFPQIDAYPRKLRSSRLRYLIVNSDHELFLSVMNESLERKRP